MPDIPAFCNNCGAAFRSGIFIGGNATATLTGNMAGPCPVCGGMGTIPDGVFKAAGNVLQVLTESQSTIERLRELSNVLSKSKDSTETPEKTVEKLKETAPELSSLLDALPKTRVELYNFLLVIFAAITVLISYLALTGSGGPSEDEIQKMIDDTVEKAIIESQNNPPNLKDKHKKKLNESTLRRNDVCSCGSGKRFKHCCGKFI